MNDLMISDKPYDFVAYLPYVILSYQTVYGNLYERLEDVFKSPYASAIQDFYTGRKTLWTLNTELATKLKEAHGASIPTKMIQDSVLQNLVSNPSHPLRLALKGNDVYDWAPKAPTRLLYCKGDDQVSYTNSIVADSVMNGNGAIDLLAVDVNSDLNHGQCIGPAVVGAYFFFRQYQRIDDVSNTSDLATPDIAIFPNPASTYINVSSSTPLDRLRLYSLDGQLVMDRKLGTDVHMIDLYEMPKGIYTIQVIAGSNVYIRKLLVR